jgi:membrane protease YdiL (CAAX protease family)
LYLPAGLAYNYLRCILREREAVVPDLLEDLRYHLLAYGSVAGVAASLALLSWLLSRRARLLPLQRWRRANWGGGQVLFVFLVMTFVPVLVEAGLLGHGFFHLVYGKEPSPTRMHLWANPIAFPLIIPTILVPLYLLRGTRPADLGLTTARALSNVTLACLAWFPLTFLTLAAYFVALQCTNWQEHPLTKLAQDGLARWEWWLLGLEAVVTVPIVEELVFRGVLQGWLVRCSRVGHIAVMMAAVLVASIPYFPPKDKEPEIAPLLFALCLIPGYLFVLFRYGPTERELDVKTALRLLREGSHLPEAIQAANHGAVNLARVFARTGRFPLPAIYGSSMLFAVFHSSVWPSPIALFILALGLGWLASRTQSLVSPIIVHALFNAVALLVLVLQQQA